MVPEEKNNAINLAITQIERDHGKGAIMRLTDTEVVPVEVIPTGSLSLDIALGVGGVYLGAWFRVRQRSSAESTHVAEDS